MMSLRERRVRRYIGAMCAQAASDPRLATYDAGSRIGLRRGDQETARRIASEMDYAILVVNNQSDVPKVCVVGVTAPTAWRCYLQAIRGLIISGMSSVGADLFDQLREVRDGASEDYGGVHLDDPREIVLADITDAEASGIRAQYARIKQAIPPDIEARLVSRRIVLEP